MADIDIRLDDREVKEALYQLDRSIADMTPIFREIAAVLADDVEQAFDDESDPTTGNPWPDLADSTKNQRAKRGKWPGKKLQMTAGGLAASIASEYGRDYAAVGTNKLYAAVHQFGGQAGRNHAVTIPARPYFGLSDEGRDEILDIIREHLERAVK